MRANLLLFSAALLSFVVATAGCSTPSLEGDGPNLLGGSKGKTKKDRSTTETDETEDETETETDPSEPAPSTPPPPSDGTDPDTPPPPPTGGACSTSATRDACFTCCEEQHPQGIQVLQQAFGNCVCGNGAGNCAAQCGGSFCVGGAPSALCAQCLDAADTCRLQADATCEQTPACNAMFQCDTASQCASKP